MVQMDQIGNPIRMLAQVITCINRDRIDNKSQNDDSKTEFSRLESQLDKNLETMKMPSARFNCCEAQRTHSVNNAAKLSEDTLGF